MIRNLMLSGCLSTAMMAFVFPAQGATAPDRARAERQTNQVFENVQSDAYQALDHAANLESFRTPDTPSWRMVSRQLNDLRAAVNDMSRQLQSLDNVRKEAAPWQQAAIDRMSQSERLLANYTKDAIRFADANHHDLWNLTYHRYLTDAGHDARILMRTADHAVERAKLQQEGQSSRDVRASS